MSDTDPPLCAVHVGKAVKLQALTPELTEKLVELLRVGNYVEVACEAAGVARSTFYDTLGRDAALRERVHQARAEGEARNVTLIARAAAKSWQAAAWLLERGYADRWGRPGQRGADVPPPPASLPGEQPSRSSFDALDELAPRREARATV